MKITKENFIEEITKVVNSIFKDETYTVINVDGITYNKDHNILVTLINNKSMNILRLKLLCYHDVRYIDYEGFYYNSYELGLGKYLYREKEGISRTDIILGSLIGLEIDAEDIINNKREFLNGCSLELRTDA